MLTNLKRKSAALKAFSFEDELRKIVSSNTDKIADLQAAQLAKGINSKGEKINPPYRPVTIDLKKRFGVGLGAITDRVTFFSKGNLYRSLSAEVQGNKFRIKSPLFTFDKMIKRSGVNTVGLNVESRTDFIIEITRPQILKALKTKVIDI